LAPSNAGWRLAVQGSWLEFGGSMFAEGQRRKWGRRDFRRVPRRHESFKEIHISLAEICIFLREIHKSLEEIHIFLPKIHKSLEEIPISSRDLCISLGVSASNPENLKGATPRFVTSTSI